MPQRKVRAKPIVGWREWVVLSDMTPVPLKAKIDTGARTSALHAFGLRLTEKEGVPWVDFDIHPVQRSKTQSTHISLPVAGFKRVRSSSGHSEERPVIRTKIEIGPHRLVIDLSLTSRDEMGFRMLVGRSAIRRRFWVDPGRSFLYPTSEPRLGLQQTTETL